jgi:hypothetical protein
MDRYLGVYGQSRSCTFGIVSAGGRRLESKVVETNGRPCWKRVSLKFAGCAGAQSRMTVLRREGTRS